MAAAIELRGDLSGDDLRRLARDSRDAKQVRRLLALAAKLARIAWAVLRSGNDYGRRTAAA